MNDLVVVFRVLVREFPYFCLTFMSGKECEFDYTMVDKSSVKYYVDFCYGLNYPEDFDLAPLLKFIRFLTMGKVDKKLSFCC